MNIESKLKNIIKNAIDLDIDASDIEIEVPAIKEHGDFSSNIAMKCCKKLGKSPILIAQDIINNISDDLILKVEVKGPGFISFFVKKDYLLENIKTIIKEDENYGRSNIGNNTKINVEFVSVNPTGIIHVGHGRGACFGDSLCNILSFSGHDVTREYYINDAGNQMINMALSIKERYKEICGLESHMEENYYMGEEIKDVAKMMYEENKDAYLDSDI